MKIVTILGTRPEIIRLSRVLPLLDKHLTHVIVHTGQNYDYELNEIFYEDLEIRKPDIFLNIETKSLGRAVGDIISKSESMFLKEKPDGLLVLGDTNSCLAAYMAKRLKIPIFHMEAGNRCFDQNVPEETNRKIIDHIADFNLVYTEHARRHLVAEGLPQRRIYLTGSPMNEVLQYYSDKINSSSILSKLKLEKKKYFTVSFHREENVDNSENIKTFLNVLERLEKEYKYPIIVSTHPRTQKRLEEISLPSSDNIRFLKPFCFTDFVKLQKEACCTLSDSGTISEESAIMSFPAVSIRKSMERPEAQDAGTIILSGLDSEVIINSINLMVKRFEPNKEYLNAPAEYKIPDTSWRVLNLIMGNTKLSNIWSGINKT